jgi:hypothetical protein
MIMILAYRFVMLVAQQECPYRWCGCVVVVASARRIWLACVAYWKVEIVL